MEALEAIRGPPEQKVVSSNLTGRTNPLNHLQVFPKEQPTHLPCR
jgi:hypothetical protein